MGFKEMRSKRVPDRVHVVRAPEQDTYTPRRPAEGQNIEIVRILAQISDKLKRSEAERYELLNELREYRKSLRDLEDKTESTEKAYLSLEHKIKTTGSLDAEAIQRQAKFERALKATEEKMVKAIAGQALIDKRLKDTEEKQVAIDQRLDQSVTEQIRLDRQLELTAQDKSRLMRKIERLEDIVTETQDTLKAKAMVLLTDQSTAAQGRLSAPAWGENSPRPSAVDIEDNRDWWQKHLTTQNVAMAAMIIAALLTGWAINQMQQPEIPQIAVLQNGGLAKLNLKENRWEAVTEESAGETSNDMDLGVPPSEETIQPVSASTEVLPEDVTEYSDEQLLAALNNDPEQLASKLNDIEPGAVDSEAVITKPEKSVTPAEKPKQKISSLLDDPKITKTMENFDKVAFAQDPKVQKEILAQKSSLPLSQRVITDATLPETVQNIEAETLKGNAEAQHDLAAIYTAGHGGVKQNFTKAAFWFREAADAGIANARYNLGVLSHQGLGTDRDLARALYWYREAAKLDHAEAQYNLGIASIEGIGTEYNPQLAAAFFERAANNGIMEAAYNLGLIYDNGLLGEAKPDEALLWYKIAADQGSKEARTAMEQLAKNLQIGMDDVDKLVERMQQINKSVKGRRAGPSKS